MTPEHVLEFEVDQAGEVLDVYASESGLRLMIKKLTALLDQRDTHVHLMSKSWAGNELTEIPYDPSHKVIHKITIHRYKPGYREMTQQENRPVT